MQAALQNQTPPISQTKQIDAAPYITALFTANGQLRLAAERCSVSPEEMIYTIASDPNAQSLFESHLKVYALLKAFEIQTK